MGTGRRLVAARSACASFDHRNGYTVIPCVADRPASALYSPPQPTHRPCNQVGNGSLSPRPSTRTEVRQCRYRGLPRTHVQHVLTAASANIIRLTRGTTQTAPRPHTPKTPVLQRLPATQVLKITNSIICAKAADRDPVVDLSDASEKNEGRGRMRETMRPLK